MTEVKRIDIKEFRELGFLQEANRQFFHPLGLALEVVVADCEKCGGHGRRAPRSAAEKGKTPPCAACGGSGKVERLGGVWDYRDDPEGIAFAGPPGSMIDEAKMANVEREWRKHEGARRAIFLSNSTVQHLHGELVEDEEST